MFSGPVSAFLCRIEGEPELPQREKRRGTSPLRSVSRLVTRSCTRGASLALPLPKKKKTRLCKLRAPFGMKLCGCKEELGHSTAHSSVNLTLKRHRSIRVDSTLYISYTAHFCLYSTQTITFFPTTSLQT